MLYFQNVRTSRFSFTLQELTIADTRNLLNIPPHLFEKTRGEFLKRAIKEIHWNENYSLKVDLGDLTVQERIFIESIYIGQSSNTPDFLVGEKLKLSDYLNYEKQYQPEFNRLFLGEAGGDKWFIKPLTGRDIEIIEALIFSKADKPTRLDWFIYAMSACLLLENEEEVTDASEIERRIEHKYSTFNNYQESEFLVLFSLFTQAIDNKNNHLFNINFDEEGIICLSLPREGATTAGRFCSLSAINEVTKRLVGKFKNDH